MSALRKCRNLLFGALLFCATRSFAEDSNDAEENIVEVLRELEEAENEKDPSYASKIYFTLPVRFGFNCPIKNNGKVGKDKAEFSFWGSNTFSIPFFVNFPFGGHFVAAIGPEIEFSSFSWDGKRELAKVKIFHKKDNSDTVEEVQKKAIESTTFNFVAMNVIAKLRFHFDRFDPTDGFYGEISGGIGGKFWATLEQKMNKQYDGMAQSFSDNDKLLGLNHLNTFAGIELGYQRFGIFYQQHFTSVFTQKVKAKKVCSLPLCAGIVFNLI